MSIESFTYYHTVTDLHKAGGIWPLVTGLQFDKPNYKIGPRFIRNYSLHFVLNGQLSFVQGGQQVILGKGDLFCLFPDMTHQYETHVSPQPLHLFWFNFNGNQAGLLLERIGLTRDTPYTFKKINTDIEAFIHKIPAIFKQIELKEEDIFLLSVIYRLFSMLAKESSPTRLKRKPSAWLPICKDYMDTHFTEGITVQNVADYAGVERSHFTKKFIETNSVSPKDYLKKLKMEKAAAMIRETQYSITEIALSVGFPDLYSFSKAFRQYFGQTPSSFRS